MEKSLLQSTRMLPCAVVLLTAGTKEVKDAMTATAMFVAEKVPLITISLSKKSTCHEIIEQTGECALNVASVQQVDLARKLGVPHRRNVDKFEAFGIKTEKAKKNQRTSHRRILRKPRMHGLDVLSCFELRGLSRGSRGFQSR